MLRVSWWLSCEESSSYAGAWVPSLHWEDPLLEVTTTHSSIAAWKIPWTEEPGGLQSVGHIESDLTEVTELKILTVFKRRTFREGVRVFVIIFYCMQNFSLTGGKISVLLQEIVLSLKLPFSSWVGVLVHVPDLRDSATYIPWGETRALTYLGSSVSWQLLLCFYIPSLAWMATVWICPLEHRGGHGGWMNPNSYKEELEDIERICIQECPTGVTGKSLFLTSCWVCFFDHNPHFLVAFVITSIYDILPQRTLPLYLT